MKQQFFVGDKVTRYCEFDNMYGGVAGEIYEITEVRNDGQDLQLDRNAVRNPCYYRIVERAWQKNTGEQPVDSDVYVEYKQRDMVWQAERAGNLLWEETIARPITEWRIADSVSSNEEQPEAIPPSHVALGDNFVQVGEPYMKIWCDTCQGTGEIDETVGGESFSSRDTPCPDCDGKGWWERKGDVDQFGFGAAADEILAGKTQQDKKHSHYFKKCGYDYVDVYRILKMFDVTDPCISHACKKLLVTGGRGFKNIDHDIQDVIDTLVRWQEMRKEDSGG